MNYIVEPKHGEATRVEMIVIGHLEGLAIAKSEDNTLFYELDQNECMEIGTYCEADEMHPVYELPEDSIKKIIMAFGSEVG